MDQPQPDSPIDVVTTQLTLQADGVVAVRLQRPDRAPLPAWSAGAHVDLILPVGITRQYSLMGDPEDRTSYTVTVLQQPTSRGGSEYVHVFLRPGQRIAVSAPRNHFPLEPAPAHLLIAGGIGITPLMAMAREASARGEAWTLHYGGRSRRTMAYADALRAEHGERVHLWPEDVRGRMPLDGLLADRRTGARVHCCGPEALLNAVRTTAAEHGWPEDAVHFERFAPTVHAHAPDRPVTVLAARSGVEVLVGEDESLLDGLLRAGVRMTSSCRSGVCGACQTGVLDGEPDHRDDILTTAQRDANAVMMPCVSRARGERIVLDA
ncbi:PDR/VanB family oxidoreductase [Patulibacter sp. S7RM1-6]